jgi:hypothetical protein
MFSSTSRRTIGSIAVTTAFRSTTRGWSTCCQLNAAAAGEAGPRRPREICGVGGGVLTQIDQKEFRAIRIARDVVVEVVGDASGQPAHRLHLLGLAQLSLERFAVADVRIHHDDPTGGARLVEERCRGQAELESVPVLANPLGFIVGQRLAGHDSIAESLHLVHEIGRHDRGKAADDLLRPPSEERLGRPVPAQDVTVGRQGVDLGGRRIIKKKKPLDKPIPPL